MLEALLVHSLCCYLVFHVVGRSDLLVKPREWAFRTLPGWLTYPVTCALCATWWMGVGATLVGLIDSPIWMLLAAPVVNMVLDLVVTALMRANEPPVMGEGKTLTSGDLSITTWRAPSVVVGTATQAFSAGQLVAFQCCDGVQPVSIHDPRRDDPDYRFARWDIGGTWPWPTDVGRRIKLTSNPYDPRGGRLVLGRTGIVQEVSPITCAWAYRVKADDGADDFCCDPQACTFLDQGAPFNPLDHEQTR